MAPSSSNNTSQLSQTHPYTGDRGYHAWCHLLVRSDDHTYTIGRGTKSKLGFSILPGIKPPTFRLVCDNSTS